MYCEIYINKKTNYHRNVRFYVIKIDLFFLKTIKHQNSSVRVFTISSKKILCSVLRHVFIYTNHKIINHTNSN